MARNHLPRVTHRKLVAPQAAPPPPAAPTDPREIGRQLAIEQMMSRSSKAAAAARKLEAEKQGILEERQKESLCTSRSFLSLAPPSRRRSFAAP